MGVPQIGVGTPALYLLPNRGRQAEAVRPETPIPLGGTSEIQFLGGADGWAVGTDPETGVAVVLRISDGGIRWVRLQE